MPPLPTRKPVSERAVNVLVLCHGNICRSPLAGAVLEQLLPEGSVRDRGLSTTERRLAAKKVRDYAERLQLNLSGHRSRRVTQEDCDWAHIVVYMDGGNRKRLGEFRMRGKLCLGAVIGLPRIPDPNYMRTGSAELKETLDDVVRACRRLAALVNKKSPDGEPSEELVNLLEV